MPVPLPLPAPPAIAPMRPRTFDYDETIRLTLSTPTAKSAVWKSGFTGWLVGVTIFVDAVDASDTMSITLNGRVITGALPARGGIFIEEDLYEEINLGDEVALNYISTGTLLKNIDFTPQIKYPRS